MHLRQHNASGKTNKGYTESDQQNTAMIQYCENSFKLKKQNKKKPKVDPFLLGLPRTWATPLSQRLRHRSTKELIWEHFKSVVYTNTY